MASRQLSGKRVTARLVSRGDGRGASEAPASSQALAPSDALASSDGAPDRDVEARRRWRVALPAAALLGAWAATRPGPAVAAGDVPPSGRAAGPDVSRLPPPGSYDLPRLFVAPDGEVLLPDGRAMKLSRVLTGRLSVVSFIYSYCRDPEGCPLAWQALDAVRNALLADPVLARRAQLVTISFDPTNDTPEQMRLLGGSRIDDPRARWWYLTTASVPRLLPLLDGFGQDVSVEHDDQGRPTRTLNHLLKLFTVDGSRQVREIYSVATLAPEAIINDLRTLVLDPAGG